MPSRPYPLTGEHYHAFGIIIQQFARFERIVEGCISAALKSEYGTTVIAISQLSYSAKCDSLRSILLVEGNGLIGHQETIIGFVVKFNEYSGLRNSIAHSIWIDERREGSIKPVSAIHEDFTDFMISIGLME